MDYFRYHVLSFILFEPLIGAAVILLISRKNEDAIRWVANLTAFAGFLISIPLSPTNSWARAGVSTMPSAVSARAGAFMSRRAARQRLAIPIASGLTQSHG